MSSVARSGPDSAGARLSEGLDRWTLELKQIRAVDAPGVTHIKYEVA